MASESYILALTAAFGFMTLLVILGMPSIYQFLTGFDFLWFGGGMITITTACVVITGVPCAAATAVYSAATILGYVGLGGFLSSTTTGTVSIIKAIILTPITILVIWMFSKHLARGSGGN